MYAKTMLIDNLLDRVGLEESINDDLFTRLLRKDALKLSCDYEMEFCQNKANECVSKILENFNPEL